MKYKLIDIYRQIKEEETASQVSQYKIYCDMDGVLCDFDRRFKQFSWDKKSKKYLSPKEYKSKFGVEKFWNLINQVGAQFWSEMPWMPEGKKLWEYISKHSTKPTLLSSPSSDYSSRYGKKLWVQENMPGTKLILAKQENKQDYSGKNKILIDDRADTIGEWNARGGTNTGILFTSTDQTINKLKQLGLNYDK